MIVGLYQCPSPGSTAKGLEVVAQAMEEAAGVDMLVFPEAFLPGYGAVTDVPEAGVEAALATLAAKHRIALTIGLPEYAEGKVYNTALAIGADGETLARHRKTQLFGARETALYTPGTRYTTFRYKGRTFGLLVCYEVEFPEHVRAMARAGAEVILVPTANMMPHVNVNLIMVPSRAAENAVTVVYANYCGSEGDLAYVGQSGIYGPDGYLLAGKGQNAGLCIAELPSGWSERDIPLATQIADLRTPN